MNRLLFGTVTNLAVSGTVIVFGLAWIISKKISKKSFRFRTYVFWWASWLAWVLAWSILLLKELYNNKSPEIDILVLGLDDLNAVFLILTYFALTRGNSYSFKLGILHGIAVVASLLLAYGTLYIVFHNAFELAYELHKTWSLCLAVFAPILVGWGFHLRFEIRIPLAVGFVYGFAQPIVYAIELPSKIIGVAPIIEEIKPVISLILAFLKILWAVVCVRILYSAKGKGSNLVGAVPNSEFRFWRGRWPHDVAAYTVLLIVVYIGLTVYLTQGFSRYLGDLGLAIGIVTALIAVLSFAWDIYEKLVNEQT